MPDTKNPNRLTTLMLKRHAPASAVIPIINEPPPHYLSEAKLRRFAELKLKLEALKKELARILAEQRR